jgi:hypothetical protein
MKNQASLLVISLLLNSASAVQSHKMTKLSQVHSHASSKVHARSKIHARSKVSVHSDAQLKAEGMES